ncbi:putative uncharacterized protein [Waddlia chondrophila 2032/99]|uniref:Uncharacterized protein n=2 Tax=Waddlia chondrophila TaxID=71667 RepID=D6YV83_WADCW|nr:hypothetical protein [Waddlia chondrophila]ADI38044.1 conserved hypothetical protein [Waddlia chondrophila WSU 86-1044]CCB91092.1 putative uncharacterized protein [Waddlia chondrophila 2032/99]
MPNKQYDKQNYLSILDAVETLSSIVDIDFEREIEVANDEEIKEQDEMVTAHTMHWLETEDRQNTVKHIKETFHVVHEYLKDFYEHEYSYVSKPKVMEGVKTIMVLVGEAAKKLDKFTTLFKETKERSVKNLKEYRDLQEFYLTRIARKIDEGILGKWILELTKGSMAKRKAKAELKAKPMISVKHVFIDMESVKNDTEYELFFLRKEDGSRFFNPRLIRNIKLTADFGQKIRSKKSSDPLEQINIWQDHLIHVAARNILQAQGGILDRFFREAKESWRRELASELYKAVVALMMCACPKNLLSNAPTKACTEYFIDFHHFLRNAYVTGEYQRYLAYPPKKSSKMAHILMDLVHGLSRAMFTRIKAYQQLVTVFEKMVEEANQMQSEEHQKAAEESNTLWSRLAGDYAALSKMMKTHPNGPLVKVLEVLEKGAYHVFDPIAQLNLPGVMYSLFMGENRITNLHLPAPMNQGFIHQAEIVNEFKGFLRAYMSGQFKRKHLLFNFQDRTSWKEHVRAVNLEQLSNQRLFSKYLTVVSLPKDTDFYHQVSPYQDDHQAGLFIEHFKDNLSDESCGFVFPFYLSKKLFPNFINQLFEGVHKLFFHERNVLSVKDRLDFIEIFYMLLELKIIEEEQPATFSMTCKDGIDIGGCASAELFGFLKMINNQVLSNDEYMEYCTSLFMPAIISRERIIHTDRFGRMITAFKRIESTQQEMGKKAFAKAFDELLGSLFHSPILRSELAFPRQ